MGLLTAYGEGFLMTPLELSALLSGVFKKDHALVIGFADPGKFGLPVVNMLYKSRKRVTTERFRNINFDLMTFFEETQIERAQIAIVADT